MQVNIDRAAQQKVSWADMFGGAGANQCWFKPYFHAYPGLDELAGGIHEGRQAVETGWRRAGPGIDYGGIM